MTKTAHTPGPWHVDSCDDDLIYSANGWHIATVGNEAQEQPAHEITANAQLIAAAPELLDALEFVRMTFADIEASKRKGYYIECPKVVAAAIGKAKGGAK
jgi:hypothetical protein